MKNFPIINIITEEINKFDFLSNDDYLKSQEITDLIQNEDLQKQFICDLLLNKKVKKIQVVEESITDANEDNTNITIQYIIDISYLYDSTKEPINFNLEFIGENVDVKINNSHYSGNYDEEPTGESWYEVFNWDDINVSLFTMDGEEIEFKAFNNAPLRIQKLFIRNFIQNFIESNTFEIRTTDIKDNGNNLNYC